MDLEYLHKLSKILYVYVGRCMNLQIEVYIIQFVWFILVISNLVYKMGRPNGVPNARLKSLYTSEYLKHVWRV